MDKIDIIVMKPESRQLYKVITECAMDDNTKLDGREMEIKQDQFGKFPIMIPNKNKKRGLYIAVDPLEDGVQHINMQPRKQHIKKYRRSPGQCYFKNYAKEYLFKLRRTMGKTNKVIPVDVTFLFDPEARLKRTIEKAAENNQFSRTHMFLKKYQKTKRLIDDNVMNQDLSMFNEKINVSVKRVEYQYNEQVEGYSINDKTIANYLVASRLQWMSSTNKISIEGLLEQLDLTKLSGSSTINKEELYIMYAYALSFNQATRNYKHGF